MPGPGGRGGAVTTRDWRRTAGANPHREGVARPAGRVRPALSQWRQHRGTCLCKQGRHALRPSAPRLGLRLRCGRIARSRQRATGNVPVEESPHLAQQRALVFRKLKRMYIRPDRVLRGHGHLVLGRVDVRARSAPPAIDEALVRVARQSPRPSAVADRPSGAVAIAITGVLLAIGRDHREGELGVHGERDLVDRFDPAPYRL